jgi:hypothetical protein
MQPTRGLRVALPPFVLYGAVILAYAVTGTLLEFLAGLEGHKTVVAGIVAASIVPLGYVIGGMSILTLKLFGYIGLVGHGRYDLPYKSEDTSLLLDDLGIVNGTEDDRLNAARTFIHEAKDAWLTDFVSRLWDASMAYFGSMIALILSALYVYVYLKATSICWWWIMAGVMFLVFLGSWYTARKEIDKVVTFQIKHRASTVKAIPCWKGSDRAFPESEKVS